VEVTQSRLRAESIILRTLAIQKSYMPDSTRI
jgi:hypothetical protein